MVVVPPQLCINRIEVAVDKRQSESCDSSDNASDRDYLVTAKKPNLESK